MTDHSREKAVRNVSYIPSCLKIKKNLVCLETGKGDEKFSVCSRFLSVYFTVPFLTCVSELSFQ